MTRLARPVIVVERMLSDEDKTYLFETIGNIVAGATTAIQQDLTLIKADIGEIKADVSELKADVAELKADVAELRADVVELKAGQADLASQLAHQRLDINDIRRHVAALSRHGMQREQAVDERFRAIEADIEELKKSRNPP